MQCSDLRRRLAGCLCLLTLALPAHALDPQRAIRQLTHVWYQNQLPQGTVLSIAQKPDGTLWLATYGGLVRHSGAEFENIDQRVAPKLRSSAITAVGVDRDGTLFVGTLNGGLYRQAGRELVPVELPAAVESVFGIVPDGDEALWLTTNAGVVRIVANEAHLLGTEHGFPRRGFYRAMVADREGGIWIAADGLGVVHWRNGAVRVYEEADGLPTAAVYSLALAADGTVWAGTQAGPVRFRDGRFEREPRAAALDDRRIYSLHGDRDGNLWFAPLGLGLCRLTTTRFDCDDGLDGMGGETVRSMFEDREGNLWVGTTSSGIHRFSNSKLVTATGEMVSNAIRAVYQDGGGTIWVGTDGAGLARYEEQRLVPADAINAGLPSQLVRAILDDDEGRLWIGGTEGVNRIAPDGGIRHFGLDDGLPGTIVFAFARARAGGVWVGSLQGVARIHGDAVTVVEATVGDDTRALYEAPDGRLWIGLRSGLRCLKDGVLDRCGTSGLPGMSVFAFHPARDGSLWIGTSIGLIRVRGGETTTYAQRAGFFGDAVFAILDDGAGHFWVSSNRGIARIAEADLAALDNGAAGRIEPQWFGQHDGMLASQANGASQTPAWRTRDGRLWFGTVQGVVIVDPAHLLLNTEPPPVVIEGLLVNGREHDPAVGVALGPGVERIELRFAATSYVAPAAVRYRYRLHGYDADWNEAGTTRVAHYTRLPPGRYTFQAIASNNDGVWNEQGASFAFDILPAWHQTTTFRTGAVLGVLALLLGLYRLRLWQLRARERELLREVAQRTEQLRQANERLQRLASLDGLTRIANRGAFDRRLQAAWLQQAGTRRPLAVLLADIDAFKAYNDSYGHLAGDATLTAVAEALAQNLRSEADLAARYGGEEFAVLLPDCDGAEALRVAQRLREQVRGLGIQHRASDVVPVVSISIGVAATCPQPGEDPDDLLRRADEALYQAKAEGRDRVVLAGGA